MASEKQIWCYDCAAEVLPFGCEHTAKPPRKVVQIAPVVGHANSTWQGHVELYALCDDGTVWSMFGADMDSRGSKWFRLPDIPQEEPKC